MDPQKAEIALRLGEWLANQGWSKAEFARKMQIQPQSVNGYLSGSLDPRNLISQLLSEGCDIEWLLTGIRSQNAERKTEEEAKMLARLRSWGLDTDGKLAYFLNATDIAQDAMRKVAERIAKYQVKKKKGGRN